MTLQEFTDRFTKRCLVQCGFTHFDDGMAVSKYCADVAKFYHSDPFCAKNGPEECADSDMSYWGEE